MHSFILLSPYQCLQEGKKKVLFAKPRVIGYREENTKKSKVKPVRNYFLQQFSKKSLFIETGNVYPSSLCTLHLSKMYARKTESDV